MFKKINKYHLVFIAIIFLLSIFFLHSIISTTKIMNNVHHINDVTFVSENLKQSLFRYGQLHLWTPYYYSGQPLYSQPEYYFLDLNFIYIILFRDIFIAMNLATITYFFLSGLGMYFLFLALKDDKKGAFIASIIYMFNGYMHTFVMYGNLNVLAGYSLIPFAFIFFIKALRSDNAAKNAIFSGLFIAFQIFAGGTLLIPYEVILFGVYALFYIFGKDLGKRSLKLVIVAMLVISVGFGISAIKLLPGAEFLNLSNRSSGISYQEYLGYPIEISNIIHVWITNLVSNGISASVGIMGFILLIFGLYDYKKKYVIFSLAIVLISFLMATNGIVAELFFKIPIFNQLRHIERAIFLIAFSSAILAGVGISIFLDKAKKAVKNANIANIAFLGVVLLILIELLFLQDFPSSTKIINPHDIEINEYISKDTTKFRTINLALSTLVGASGYNYLAQLGIGTIKGGSGIWFNDYLTYLSIAQQANPAKLWGMLNNKYVISDKSINISGLKFIGKFAECNECAIWEAGGPYLYENLEFMPRAYYVNKSILVLGNNQNTERITYGLMLNSKFDPKKAVIIKGKDAIESSNKANLNNYDAIILSEQINNNEANILKNYVNNGGLLLPNIFKNEDSISEEDIGALFDKLNENLNGGFEEVKIINYENNKVVYDTGNKKGFLVLSERFSNFPGWQASGKGGKKILMANGIITSVFVDNDGIITLKYKPNSFKNGLIISVITFIAVLIYLSYYYTKNHIKMRGD